MLAGKPLDPVAESIATGLELVDPPPSASRAIEEFLNAVKADRGGTQR